MEVKRAFLGRRIKGRKGDIKTINNDISKR
jgi:hypothetical protein